MLKQIQPEANLVSKYNRQNCKRVFVDTFTVVQEYHLTWKVSWFKKILVRHVGITMRNGATMTKFYVLMNVKNQVCGEDCIAVQVYQPLHEIADEANMAHLFVLPKGFQWPLTLKRKW